MFPLSVLSASWPVSRMPCPRCRVSAASWFLPQCTVHYQKNYIFSTSSYKVTYNRTPMHILHRIKTTGIFSASRQTHRQTDKSDWLTPWKFCTKLYTLYHTKLCTYIRDDCIDTFFIITSKQNMDVHAYTYICIILLLHVILCMHACMHAQSI